MDSSSDPDKVYRVAISEYDYICDCKGFEYNGHCKHRAIAEQLRCRWEEGDSPNQSVSERKGHICPVCGCKTNLIVECDDDDGSA